MAFPLNVPYSDKDEAKRYPTLPIASFANLICSAYPKPIVGNVAKKRL